MSWHIYLRFQYRGLCIVIRIQRHYFLYHYTWSKLLSERKRSFVVLFQLDGVYRNLKMIIAELV